MSNKKIEGNNGKEFLLAFIDRELKLMVEVDELMELHDIVANAVTGKRVDSPMRQKADHFCQSITNDVERIINNSAIPVDGNTLEQQIEQFKERCVTVDKLRQKLAKVKTI